MPQSGASSSNARGRIVVICGCMFSGKTARLIDRLQAAESAGKRVAAFKHALDRRYDADHLRTHDGRSFQARAVPDVAEIEATDAEVVGVDEAQFFGRGLIAACRSLAACGREVVVSGIDHDAWGQPFPPLPELKAVAADVEWLAAPCAKCGRPSPYSQRVVPVRDGNMVGGPESYEPRCRDCFTPLPAPAPVYE
jgi:thymidine kinase